MAIRVRRFEPGDVSAIERLNQRLAGAGVVDRVYPEGVEQQRSGEIRERLFVATDDDEIRGGVWLKEHAFRAGGADHACGWLKYPVAESLIDQRFSGVPGALIFQCLREQPRLMALGLGGHTTPLAKMLARLKWTGEAVPLLARLVRPARAIRELAPLRRTRARAVAANVLAASGAAWIGHRAFETAKRWGLPATRREYVANHEDGFGSWADELWMRCRDAYGFLAARHSTMLNTALPVRFGDAQCVRVRRGGADVGWAFLLRHDFSRGAPDANFGRMTVGLVADVLAMPDDAVGVLDAAVGALADLGVDLVFTNQLHPAWIDACKRTGFIEGPSTFAFYRTPAANALTQSPGGAHVTRGDCDGPIWYGAR